MSSQSIYSDFKPTFLYIKEHTITGLKYFGKTVYDPEKYMGSGKYWKRHIDQHGKDHVVTIWFCLFTDPEILLDFATNFSVQNDIVESTQWANLDIETGFNGGPRQNNHFKSWAQKPKSEAIKTAASKRMKGHISDGTKSRMIRCKIDDNVFASYAEAARHYGVFDQTIYRWVKAGKCIRVE